MSFKCGKFVLTGAHSVVLRTQSWMHVTVSTKVRCTYLYKQQAITWGTAAHWDRLLPTNTPLFAYGHHNWKSTLYL